MCPSAWLTALAELSPDPGAENFPTWPRQEKFNAARVKWLLQGLPEGEGEMEFSPTKRRILAGTARDNKSIMLNMQRKACCSALLLAHILQWYFQDEHFTEQIRSFRVGESLECAAFCALVSVRDREEPLLWPIASASNAEDEIYNSAPRDECRLVLIRVFCFSSTCSRNIYPCVMCEFGPAFLTRLLLFSSACIFKRRQRFHFFIAAPFSNPAVENWFAPRVISGSLLRILFLSY